MGRLRTLTILLTLGAWGAATDGAPPDGVNPSTGAATRAPLQVPAGEYLKAGNRLISTGQDELATRYLKVANDYRDQLSPSDQATLDALNAKRNPAPATMDPAVMPASATLASPGGSAPATATAAPSASNAGRPRGTIDTKQEARWKLQGAREQLRLGNYDEASRIVAQVRTMNVSWGLFDETPDKMDEAITKARPKGTAAASATASRDRKTAQAKLKEAKGLLEKNQFEQAEAIALEVDSWNLSYSVWDEKPSKIAAQARALRRRDMSRSLPLKAQPSQTIYDVLVNDSRHLMAVGQFDQAEAKARQALKMNVVPASEADRAEAVLNDIAVARTRTVGAAPAAEPASVSAERAANELLAKGQRDAAAAKFVEAEQLRTREMAQSPAVASAPAAIDPAVRRVDNAAPLTLEMPAPAVTAVEPVASGLPDLGAAPEPAALPAPEPIGSAPLMPSIAPSATAPAGNKGEEILFQARALFGQGNYPAAREMATQAKAGGFGVDAPADDLLAQIAHSEQGSALAAYEAALDAVRQNDIPKARQLLTEVAASGAALDEAMMQKVQDLLLKLPQAGKATASDVPTSDAETLRAQKLNAEVSTRVAESRRLMETDPDAAIKLLETTLASVKVAEMPQTIARTMTRRLEVAIELARKDKVGFDIRMQDKSARAEIETKKLRILEADKAKKGAVAELMKKAEEAQSQANWAKAEELSKRAVEIDPENLAAVMLSYKANMQRHYDQYTRDKKAKEDGFLDALGAVDAASIIDPGVSANGIGFPKDFREMTERRRKAALSQEFKKDPKALAIEKKLNEPITLNLTDATLTEAITFIQNYTGLNVVLDGKALNDEGLSRDSKVSLQLNGIRLKTALKLMLRPLGLTYKVDDEVLMITSPLATRENTYAWTYPVADLVVSPAKALGAAATPGLGMTEPVSTATTSANGGATLASNGGTPTTKLAPTVTVTDMMPLVQLITSTIAPGSWRVTDVNGGADGSYGMGGGAFGGAGNEVAQPGSITPFMLSISLIIRHTAEVHEEIAELLKQLRRLQDLQVSIEVRFITVSDDFFEQIGVDFDFNIQSDLLGPKTTFAAQNPNAALFNTNSLGGGGFGTTGTGGGTTGGGTTGTGGGNSTTGGATTGGGGGGTGGGGGGGLGGGGGGFAGGGGGVGGAGVGTGGGGAGGTTGGGGTGQVNPYLVNPFLDHSLGSRTPLVTGLTSGGLKNFTGDLGIPFIQGAGNVVAQTQVFNSIPTAGATFGISFLSDLEMYLFLTAAQGDARNNIVQAPKITTFNGSNATISNNDIRYYVQQTIPIVGPNSVALQPIVGQLPDGVTLSVTPVVSSDRRYVRLSLAPQFQAVTGLTTFQGGSGAVGGSGLGGQGTSVTGTLQLPETTTTTLITTVTVPDGGTVLLGGVKRMREQRLEYGVPVLAKTPMINRLFRNIGIGRRTDSLMLMVTPRIIILEEEEERIGVRAINPNP